MIARDHFVDFELRGFMDWSGLGLINDEGNGIVDFADIKRGEVHPHRVERDKNSQVQIIIISVPHFLERADNLESDSIEEYNATHRRPARKQNSPRLIPQNQNVTFLLIV